MRGFLVVAFVAAAGCPGGKSPDRPRAAEGVRVDIARLEARRADGLDALIQLARADGPGRELALRALGRVGGSRALDMLLSALRDPDPAIAARAASAIGVLSVTTDAPPAVVARTSAALVAALARPDVDAVVVVEALGRAGDATALAPLAGRVAAADPAIAEAAAVALARFGVRKLPLDAPARAALIEVVTSASAPPAVRHAAVWAFARESHGDEKPAPDPAVTAALVAAIGDADGETRAAAIAALTRRKSVAAGASQLEQALRDPDWRVAVEAARALGGDSGTDPGRDAVAAILVRDWARLGAGGAPTDAHVMLEGLRAIAPFAARPAVHHTLAALVSASSAAGKSQVPALTRGWVHCLATAALERAAPSAFDGGTRVLACGDEAIAPHLRAQLLAGLLGAEVGTPAQRRDALIVLLATDDPLTRAAALEVLPEVWDKLEAVDRDTLTPAVTRALASTEVVEAGTAAGAAGALLGDNKAAASPNGPIAAALLARARSEHDPELAGDLLAAVGAGKLPDGKPVCEHAIHDASPVIRAAARACVAALAGRPDPDPDRALDEPEPAALPATDAATVIGKRVTWTVETSRGRIVIALEPDVAPWHVAAIAELTRRGFYAGLIFHRVVPDFVVQGGDPTGTGWGGPGFTLPAEPGTHLDGDDYRTGAVGIADAGKDSGGSQWFVMHSRAPHLEGRYTRIGRVTSGQEVVDALVVGDRVNSAWVTIE